MSQIQQEKGLARHSIEYVADTYGLLFSNIHWQYWGNGAKGVKPLLQEKKKHQALFEPC